MLSIWLFPFFTNLALYLVIVPLPPLFVLQTNLI